MTELETKPADQASTPELIDRLTDQISRLVRDEIRLAQKEFQLAAAAIGKKQVEQGPPAAREAVTSVTEDVNAVQGARRGRTR